MPAPPQLACWAAAALPAPIRVLAFGDSLTEGFTANGSSFFPYADKLQELLSVRSGGRSWGVGDEDFWPDAWGLS